MNAGKVTFYSAASGAGHIRAAEALVSAFRSKGADANQIEVLKYTNRVFRRVYSDLYKILLISALVSLEIPETTPGS